MILASSMPKHLKITALRFFSRIGKSRTGLVLLSLAISLEVRPMTTSPSFPNSKARLSKADMPIVNGIEGAAYRNSGHTVAANEGAI